MTPPFLMWYDDSRGATLAAKVRDAAAAFSARFGAPATLALVSADEPEPCGPVDGVEVRAVATVRRNTVWAGVRP